MKEKPIHFRTDMVKAILAGNKTMTRRIIKPQPDARGLRTTNVMYEDWHGKEHKPRYQIEDILYVKETYCNDPRGSIDGKSDCYYYKADFPEPNVWKGSWISSRFMPRKAARIFLEVTNIRVEKLQDITEKDAEKEGVDIIRKIQPPSAGSAAIGIFMELWQSIHGKDSWESNPWVWVYKFKHLKDYETSQI